MPYAFLARWLDVRATWKVALCVFLWLAASTWAYPLLLPDEGRYVGVAWQMLQSGDPLVPRLDGLPFFHKPPLFYWLTALSLQVFGTHEWAARLASVVAATAVVSLMFWFLKQYADQRVAALTAIILASQPFLFGGSHYANLDMTVAAAISATVVAGAVAVLRSEAGRPYRMVLALVYALAGLGFLAKGLIGVVLPGGVLFFWLLGRRRFDTMRRMLWLPGVLVFLLVAAPWMIAMELRYPGFFDYYIVYHHFQRFLESGFNNARPFWFFPLVLLALTLPWSLLLGRLRRRQYWLQTPHGAVRGLMLSWLLVVVIFFSLPTSKLVGYVLPALGPLAFFMADIMAARLAGPDALSAMRVFGRMFVVSIGICLAAVVAILATPQPSSKALARTLSAVFQPGDTLVMVHRYRYDVPFYLGSDTPVRVVADWNAPDILRTDNWRKELFEAARFDPALGQQLLIDAEQFRHVLCQARAGAMWVMIERRNLARYPYLGHWPQPFYADDALMLWRAPEPLSLPLCAAPDGEARP